MNIATDFDSFEHNWTEAQIPVSPADRGYLLRKAMDIQKLGPRENYSGAHWFMPILLSGPFLDALTHTTGMIYAMNHIGMGEMGNSQLKAARQVLTDEDYSELLDKLGIAE